MQITEVSNSAKRHADNSGNHVGQLPVELCHNTRDLTAQFHQKFLLITQQEVPFINTNEAAKKVDWPNREWQMYKCHEP